MKWRAAMPWVHSMLWVGGFLLLIWQYSWLESTLPGWFGRRGIMLERTPLWYLALQHGYLVGLSSVASITIGVLGGTLVFFPFARDFRALLLDLSSLGETFPSVAIIALTVPFLGYGFRPTLVALVIYGILPILRNTITGLDQVSADVKDSAYGVGMSAFQVLTRAALPLALPVILSGIRISVIINIGAATLGATVGAGGFGVPIISGIRSYDLALILKGSLPVAVLALAADSLLRNTEQWIQDRR